MAVNNRHPSYTPARADEWRLCRRAYDGESDIKAARTEYLPMPSGYAGMDDGGARAYAAYAMRAQFPEIMAPSIGAMVGIAHGTEIQIEMPSAMQYLHEDADGEGLTLVDMHRRITRGLLVLGRMGMLADAPEEGGQPFLRLYDGPTIINWDRDFFVLDETANERDGFNWSLVEQYRVLALEDGAYVQTVHRQGEETDTTPTRTGGGRLDHVPFAVVSAKDVGPDLQSPPLIGVARASVAMYQLSADYRHQLFWSGQETLVAINGTAPDAIGAGAIVEMKNGDGATPDLKYVSPSCSGIDAHKVAIDDARAAAAQAGARLFDEGERSQESGEARELRYRSETANLQSVAQMSCALLEMGLRNIASMLGINPAEVVVNPPRDLLNKAITPADAAALWQIVEARGLSYDTYYTLLQRGGIASPERSADEEFELIEGEAMEDLRDGEAALATGPTA